MESLLTCMCWVVMRGRHGPLGTKLVVLASCCFNNLLVYPQALTHSRTVHLNCTNGRIVSTHVRNHVRTFLHRTINQRFTLVPNQQMFTSSGSVQYHCFTDPSFLEITRVSTVHWNSLLYVVLFVISFQFILLQLLYRQRFVDVRDSVVVFPLET